MASLSPSLTRELSDSVLFFLKITDLERTMKDLSEIGYNSTSMEHVLSICFNWCVNMDWSCTVLNNYYNLFLGYIFQPLCIMDED